jgi:hypothetical protein
MATGEFVWHGHDITWWSSSSGVFTVDLKANGQRLLNGHAHRFTSVAAAKLLDLEPKRFEKEIAGVPIRRVKLSARDQARADAGQFGVQTLPMGR